MHMLLLTAPCAAGREGSPLHCLCLWGAALSPCQNIPFPLYTDSSGLWCCESCHVIIFNPQCWQPVALFPAKVWQKQSRKR